MIKSENKTEEKIDELRSMIDEIGLEVATSFTLADAIREGSTVSKHSTSGWGNGESMCALHAAVASAVARGYLG